MRLTPPTILLTLAVALVSCGTPATPAPPRATRVPNVVPTPRPPIDTADRPSVLSNMPGVDIAPSIAVHPTEGWAAIAWSSYEREREDQGTVYVKVQQRNRSWPRSSLSVSTGTVYKSAGRPAVAIGPDGTVHAVWGQGDDQAPHYSTSHDHGQTWSNPERLDVGGKGHSFRIRIAPDNTVHVVLVAEAKIWHLERGANSTWRKEKGFLPGSHNHADLLLVGARLVAAAACYEGCPNGSRAVVGYRSGGRWHTARIGGQIGKSDWLADWVSLASDGERAVCVAWSYYARPGSASSCSFDAGSSWEAVKPIAETTSEDTAAADRQSSAPDLTYDARNHTMVAVQVFREQRDPYVSYIIYSYRPLDKDYWTPDLSGDERRQQPPLRLFPETPKSRAALPEGVRVATLPSGLTLVVWSERIGEGDQEIYFGAANLSALVTGTRT